MRHRPPLLLRPLYSLCTPLSPARHESPNPNCGSPSTSMQVDGEQIYEGSLKELVRRNEATWAFVVHPGSGCGLHIRRFIRAMLHHQSGDSQPHAGEDDWEMLPAKEIADPTEKKPEGWVSWSKKTRRLLEVYCLVAGVVYTWRSKLSYKGGSFRKLGVPYLGVLIIRTRLFKVPYLDPLFFESSHIKGRG